MREQSWAKRREAFLENFKKHEENFSEAQAEFFKQKDGQRLELLFEILDRNPDKSLEYYVNGQNFTKVAKELLNAELYMDAFNKKAENYLEQFGQA